MSNKRAVKSSSGCEVFQKAMLSLSSDLSKETKSRQKRKERQQKPKSTGQKAATSKRQKNHLSQVKAKTQMANRENDKGSEKSIKSSIAEKLGLLRNPKVISSEPITTKRKPLGTIQNSSLNRVRLASASTSERLEKDLRRVLAKEDGDKLSSVTSVSKTKQSKNAKSASKPTPVKDDDSKLHRGASVSPTGSETDMDTSSNGNSSCVPLCEISLRLVEGLQTGVIFPDSNYLDNVKAELKKLMKQSDPEAYAQLMLCISDKHEDSPAINAAILAETDNTTENTGSFNILLPRFFGEASSLQVDGNPLRTLFESGADSVPADPTVPVHLTTNSLGTTSLQQRSCEPGSSPASLFPPIIQHSVTNPLSHLNISPSDFHLPTVILHPDIEPSAGSVARDNNILSQPPLLEGGGHMSFTSDPSVDFLDYLDAGSLDSATDTGFGAMSAGVNVECNHTVDVGINPARQWMPTPERPRMFPRKLY